MNRIAAFVVENLRLAWLVALSSIVGIALLAGHVARELRADERLTLLETEVERQGIELMGLTLNGNLMGSMAMLGLVDADSKRDALGEGAPNTQPLLGVLESIGRAYGAEGVFVVGQDGIIRSSWDSAGKPSTNLNVKFRPYYKMAMQGKENVYAAVSLARGDRSLYFTAPIHGDQQKSSAPIGGVVARTTTVKLDTLLRDKTDIALLLSPQGVVYASNRAEWIGQLAAKPTVDQLRAIRELKQFGNMFENKEPAVLPVSLERGRRGFEGKDYVVAGARVHWNDPSGDWRLVMLEDLSRTVPMGVPLKVALASGVVMLLVGLMALHMLRGHHVQTVAAREIEDYARRQQTSAERKEKLAAASLRLQQAKTLDELGRVFLGEAHGILGALQGVVYVFETEQAAAMRLVASYGCDEGLPAELRPGEGLLGQCAVERRPRVIEAPGDGYWRVRSGLGNAPPAALLLAPIQLQETLFGVVELAVLDAREGLAGRTEELVALLAMNLAILRRNLRTEDMLAATAAAEQANAERLAFQQVLVDTIPYPVFYKGADARFLGFNRAYEEVFAVRREQLIGKRVLDLDYLPEADRIAYQAEDEAVIAGAGSIRREIRIPFADGKPHDTLYFVSGFRRQDGSPGGLVGTFMDISALKDAERDLARLADAERFNHLAQGRERRILELKREVNDLARAVGRGEPYATALIETAGDHPLDSHPDYRAETYTEDGGRLKLEELVDLDELQTLFSGFCDSIGVAAAIIDLEGKVLASSRWQRACTDFHRVNADSCARCIESDTELALKLKDGEDFTMYRCKNGMTDCASPIVVEGQHLANVFIGQFHVGPPDLAFFAEQAHRYGYDEVDYLRAVAEAPVLDERRLPVILGFLSGFARMVATMSLARHRADEAQRALARQAEVLKLERLAAMSLAEDAARTRESTCPQESPA